MMSGMMTYEGDQWLISDMNEVHMKIMTDEGYEWNRYEDNDWWGRWI